MKNIHIVRPSHGRQINTPERQITEIFKQFEVNEVDDILYFIKPVNILSRTWSDANEIKNYIHDKLEQHGAFTGYKFSYTKDAVEYLSQWDRERKEWNIDAALKYAQEQCYTIQEINKLGMEHLASILYNQRESDRVYTDLEQITEEILLIVNQAQEAKEAEKEEE